MRIVRTALTVLVILALPFLARAVAIGVINPAHHYAWSESGGWLNFTPTGGNVVVGTYGLTGYVWIENLGWLNLSPTHGGVANNGGTLTGQAWGEQTGWVDFAGVSINQVTGQFSGIASGSAATGRISFNCGSCDVAVMNAAPTVSSVTLNGGSAITLTENTSTSVTITGTITDTNGCADVISNGTVTIALYRSGATNGSACTAESNSCYRTTSYSVQASDTCTGGADTTANVSTTISLWYYAEATDASSTYPTNTWLAAITATDAAAAAGSSTASVELNSLYALSVTGAINYGSLTANTNTGASNQTATITNTGNFKTDHEFSGTDMTAGANTIAATNEKYATTSVTYASLPHTLANAAAAKDIDLVKATTSTTASTQATYWGIAVPNGQIAGAYTGTNTFTAVYSAD